MSRQRPVPGSRIGRTVLGVVLLLWLTYVVPPLLAGRVLAYRDAGHYYFPWWCRLPVLRAEAQSWFPLWEPAEDMGRPVAADPTYATFYPPTLLASLPVAAARSFLLYHALHYLAAVGLTYWVLRRWGLSRGAAALGGICYGFGGYLIAQHANTPYLVGGAWLPLALYPFGRVLRPTTWATQDSPGPAEPCNRWLSDRDGTSASGLTATATATTWAVGAAGAAMMILGGDPQSAYHAALIGVLAVLCGGPRSSGWGRGRLRLLGGWLVWVVLAAMLAAPQLVLSLGWLSESPRAIRSSLPVWQHDVRALQRQWTQQVLLTMPRAIAPADRARLRQLADTDRQGSSPPAIDADPVYRFSFPPWRVIEWIAPNFCGRTYPVVNRWTRALGEYDTWFPSLYQGLVPAVCALLALIYVKHSRLCRWALLSLAFAWLAAAGQYGPASCANALFSTQWPGQIGSLSWLLVELLPGYSWFRYPAKWMLIASWAFAVLAAIGYENAHCHRFRVRCAMMLLTFSIGSLFLLLAMASVPEAVRNAWRNTLVPYADLSFGPVDATGAWHDLQCTWLHLAVAGFFGWLAMWRQSCRADRGALPHVLMLVLLAIDLRMAHAWQWVTVSPTLFQPSHPLAELLEVSDRTSAEPGAWQGGDLSPPGRPSTRPPVALLAESASVHRPEWAQRSSPRRMEEIIQWKAATLQPKLHLLLKKPPTIVPSCQSDTSRSWLACLTTLAEASHDEDQLRRRLRTLGIRAALRNGNPLALASHRPTVELVRDVRVIAPLPPASPSWLAQATALLLWPSTGEAATLIELSQVGKPKQPFVSTPWQARRTSQSVASSPEPGQCEVLAWRPGFVQIAVHASNSSWLVVRQSYARGWCASIVADRKESPHQKSRLPVARAQRVFQAVYVPSGEYRLQLTYHPPGFRWAAGICVLGWLAVLSRIFMAVAAKQRPGGPKQIPNAS